ncbi:MAG: NFACT RNA binding domain-containing protein [Clostridiales bacterium]|nr:NFACT RNA binding domain-containing protein [Clostridiales bacterium]
MPFDGIVTACAVKELKEKLINGKIDKIFQPKPDELIINIRAGGSGYRLLLNAGADSGRVQLTNLAQENPSTPPAFCMLSRKHLAGGRLIDIKMNSFERIIDFCIEIYNELNDLETKRLIIEIMGRHSNIILVSPTGKILDSIKHVNIEMSSVRSVMPGLPYVLPPQQEKDNPLAISAHQILSNAVQYKGTIEKYLLEKIMGFSPFLCKEICNTALIPSGLPAVLLSSDYTYSLTTCLDNVLNTIKSGKYKPWVNFSRVFNVGNEEKDIPDKQFTGEAPLDFHCVLPEVPIETEFTFPREKNRLLYKTISIALDAFYSIKEEEKKIAKKRSSLLKIVLANIEKCVKRIAELTEKLNEAITADKFKIYGDLIISNLHNITQVKKLQDKEFLLLIDYTNDISVEVPVDMTVSLTSNAQRYYKKYAKLKAAKHNATTLLDSLYEEIKYLETVQFHLTQAISGEDLEDIKLELKSAGYLYEQDNKFTIANKNRNRNKNENIKKNNKKMENKKENKKENLRESSNNQNASSNEKAGFIFHKFVSHDGLEIFAGKNNKQNDYLTFRRASDGDIWMHARNIPGSHVIIRNPTKPSGRNSAALSDQTLRDAAGIAAYFSSGRNNSSVEVDYTEVKNVKKISGAKPGMVTYANFNSINVRPVIDDNMLRNTLPDNK